MRYTNLDLSPEYEAAREELRVAELELMRHREAVAEQRRKLPEGPVVDDYVFLEGAPDLDAGDAPVREVRLSELFTVPERAVIIYHLMYGKQQTSPCPMCTMWIDDFNAVNRHVAQNAGFAIAAAADLPTLRAHARARGWHDLRLLSCGDNTFKRDLGSEDADGVQDSCITVFARDPDGSIRLTYSAHPRMSDDIDQRGIDLLCPTWHLLDLTPDGRPDDWYAQLDY